MDTSIWAASLNRYHVWKYSTHLSYLNNAPLLKQPPTQKSISAFSFVWYHLLVTASNPNTKPTSWILPFHFIVSTSFECQNLQVQKLQTDKRWRRKAWRLKMLGLISSRSSMEKMSNGIWYFPFFSFIWIFAFDPTIGLLMPCISSVWFWNSYWFELLLILVTVMLPLL